MLGPEEGKDKKSRGQEGHPELDQGAATTTRELASRDRKEAYKMRMAPTLPLKQEEQWVTWLVLSAHRRGMDTF